MKGNRANGIIDSIPCDFCDSGILTNHVCRHPGGNRKIEDEDGDLICGLATCVMCNEGNENISKCKKHREMICLPCNDDNDEISNEDKRKDDSTINPLPTFTPDYFGIYTSIKALDLDPEKHSFSGFQLLEMRAQKDVEKFSERTMKSYISFKRNRWKKDKKQTYERKWPFRDSQSTQQQQRHKQKKQQKK